MGMKREQTPIDYAAYPHSPIAVDVSLDKRNIPPEAISREANYYDTDINEKKELPLRIPLHNPQIQFLNAPETEIKADITEEKKIEDYILPFRVKYEVKREASEMTGEVKALPKKKRRRTSANVPKSQYKCVSWYRSGHKWRAQIRHNGKMLNVGYFNNELDAAKAVNFKCAELNRPMKNPGLGILQPNSTKVQSENKRLQQQVYRIEKEKQELQLEVIKLKEEIHLLKKLISTDHHLNHHYFPLQPPNHTAPIEKHY